MTKSKQAAKSAIIIMIFMMVSKVFGFAREMLIAAKFGSGEGTDAFFVALTATALITGFISGAIGTTFIPVIAEVESKEGKKGKLEHMNNMINVIAAFSLVLLLIGIIGAPVIIKLLGGGFHEEQFSLTVQFTRMGMPMILFSGLIGIFTGYLHSENRFTSPAAIGFPFNIVYIVFLLFLSARFGIRGLMVAAVLAVASQLLILLPEAGRAGFRYRFKFDLKDIYIKKVLLLSVPILIGASINDLNAIVDKALASNLIAGSISALNYANRIISLTSGVFITAITTVLFPALSKEAGSDNLEGGKRIMGYGVRLILLITLPASFGMIVLARPIIGAAFQRGEFDAFATLMTSQALIFYTMGFAATSVRALLTRVYYSLQDTRTPMINGAISVALNIVLNLILVRYMAHAGLALATGISAMVAMGLMFYGLKKKIGSLGTLGYIKCGMKSVAASLVMAVVAYAVYNGMSRLLGGQPMQGIGGVTWIPGTAGAGATGVAEAAGASLKGQLGNLIALLAAAGTGAVSYGGLCYLIGVEEVREIVGRVLTRVKRRPV